MRKPKVLIVYPALDGTAFYRAFPYHRLDIDITTPKGIYLEWCDLYNVDVVFFQRPASQVDVINIETCKRFNKPVISDYDDLATEVDDRNPAYEFYERDAIKAVIRTILRISDYVTVSTQGLKDALLEQVPEANIRVIPNAVDDKMFSLEPSYHERNKIILLRGGGCYDDQTEVLTENGFKLFKDVGKSEKVATLNLSNNELEYHTPTSHIAFDYEGSMHNVSTEYINYSVTPNHNMVYCTSLNDDTCNVSKSEEIFGRDFTSKKDALWSGDSVEYFKLPAIQIRETLYPEKYILMDDWLKFFGFWLAEGWTSQYEHGCQTGLSLFKEDSMVICSIMEKYGYTFYYSKDRSQGRICDKQLWSYMKQFGHAPDKFVPKEIKQLCSNSLDTLLEYYIKGDGHIDTKGRFRAWTSSRVLADDMAEIALKTNRAASVKNRGKKIGGIIDGKRVVSKHDCYQINFIRKSSNKFKRPTVKGKRQFKSYYTGVVYCVEVQNHTLYVRRDGKSFWCGNSHDKDWTEYKDGILTILREFPDYTLAVMGHQLPWFKEIPDNQLKVYKFTDIPTYFDLLMQLRPEIMIVPLQDTKFNRCKSNIAWIEGTLAGAVVMASDLPEFSKVYGCWPFVDNQDIRLIFDSLQRCPEDIDVFYRMALKELPLLSKVNEDRMDLIEECLNLAKKYSPKTLKATKPATDEEFHNYSLAHGHTQDFHQYQQAHAGTADWLVKTLKPKTALELGCGTGATLVELLKRGVMAHGWELNPLSYTYFQEHHPMYANQIHLVDFTKEPIETDEPADLLLSIEVFEHINMPEERWNSFISDLATKFRHFYFSSTPYSDSEYFDTWWGHSNLRKPSAWIKLFESNGWKYSTNPRLLTSWDMILDSKLLTGR